MRMKQAWTNDLVCITMYIDINYLTQIKVVLLKRIYMKMIMIRECKIKILGDWKMGNTAV